MFRDLVPETKEHIGGCMTSVTLLEVLSLSVRMNYGTDFHRSEYDFRRRAVDVPQEICIKRGVRFCEHGKTAVVGFVLLLFAVNFSFSRWLYHRKQNTTELLHSNAPQKRQ